jgi:hypothetical protein
MREVVNVSRIGNRTLETVERPDQVSTGISSQTLSVV